MPRQIDKIRKMSAHDLAELLEEVVNVESGSLECPICVGCAKAQKNKWNCVKAREEFLKSKLPDERI